MNPLWLCKYRSCYLYSNKVLWLNVLFLRTIQKPSSDQPFEERSLHLPHKASKSGCLISLERFRLLLKNNFLTQKLLPIAQQPRRVRRTNLFNYIAGKFPPLCGSVWRIASCGSLVVSWNTRSRILVARLKDVKKNVRITLAVILDPTFAKTFPLPSQHLPIC